VVRKVTVSTGIISIYAGTGFGGYSGDGGLPTAADLDQPQSVAFDAYDNLYIADYRNNVIRKVDAQTGIITTVAGNGVGAGTAGGEDYCGYLTVGVKATTTSLCDPQSVAVDSEGNLYIVQGNRVLKVTASTGILSVFAGTGSYGYSGDGGPAVNAELDYSGGLAVDNAGNLYIADTDNCAIRKVTASTGIITSLVGTVSPSGS
jgi:sugar lactone lactonase YvrE